MSRKEKQKSKKTLFIIRIMQLIFLILLIYSSLCIIVWAKNNKENKEIISNIEKSVEIDSTNDEEHKYKVNFEKLKQENSDTVAWLKVENTNIEIPVVQAKDNSYYLTHNFNKKYNVAGWVFADYKNKFDETDKNIVVYGHNMRDDSMFGSLKNVINEEWYDNKDNQYITFITENEYQTYQIFSIYVIDNTDDYLITNFSSNDSFISYINKSKERSIKDFNVDVTENDSIVTLSTCYTTSAQRLVIQAKRI